MSALDDGGSAFPVNTTASVEPGAYVPDPGMSLRDWFAGQALAGDLSSQNEATGEWPNEPGDGHVEARVRLYYRFADAMLAERVKVQS